MHGYPDKEIEVGSLKARHVISKQKRARLPIQPMAILTSCVNAKSCDKISDGLFEQERNDRGRDKT